MLNLTFCQHKEKELVTSSFSRLYISFIYIIPLFIAKTKHQSLQFVLFFFGYSLLFFDKSSEKLEIFSIFLQKAIDKGRKIGYNLIEPNGSLKNGGENEIKKHDLLFDDRELR